MPALQKRLAWGAPGLLGTALLALTLRRLNEHLDDPFARLAEMTRVLRPHGPLAIVVTRRGLPDTLLRLRWRHTRIDRARLTREAEEAGFSEVRPHPLLAGCPLPRRTSVAYAEFKRPQGYVARAGGRRSAETSKLPARRNGANERPQTRGRPFPIGEAEERP